MSTVSIARAATLQVPQQRGWPRGLLRRSHRPIDPKVGLLASLGLFEGVTQHVLESLAPLVEHLDLPAGERLLTEGAVVTEAFLLVDGVAQAHVRGRRLGDAHAGELLGDLALLRSGRSSVTWEAVTDVGVLTMAPRELHELLRRCPLVADRVHGLADVPPNVPIIQV